MNLMEKYVLEALGTGMIVIFGVGSVCSAVLTKAQAGVWQVAVVWSIGIAIAIACTKKSGTHLNPAVTLGLTTLGKFPTKEVLPYILSQLCGAIIAAFINYGLYYRYLDDTVYTAMVFGEYFPNPAIFKDEWLSENFSVSIFEALFIEAWGTFILMMVILALGEEENANIYIGLTVGVLISLYAPLTMGGWNPARDFGPRVVAWIIGYGKIAIPGPRNGFWIYILGPIIGAQGACLLWKVKEDNESSNTSLVM
jgi:glycerol uptake facilitator protein